MTCRQTTASSITKPRWRRPPTRRRSNGLDREDGLIIHYTSGSTGKPKASYHVQNAMIQHYFTGRIVLDLQEDDIYWCTADPGWVTGTSYGIFAPWLNGATNVIRGGRFSPQDWYKTIENIRSPYGTARRRHSAC